MIEKGFSLLSIFLEGGVCPLPICQKHEGGTRQKKFLSSRFSPFSGFSRTLISIHCAPKKAVSADSVRALPPREDSRSRLDRIEPESSISTSQILDLVPSISIRRALLEIGGGHSDSEVTLRYL